MSLPTSYMSGGFGKISQYFETLLSAKAPEKFTVKFMEDLGFKSSNDRQFVNVLKAIKFIDESGVPTPRYYNFLDQSQSKLIVAEGIKEAYEDLFALNTKANTLQKNELEGKFKTLTNGSKTPATITQMVNTFVELCNYADWTDSVAKEAVVQENKSESKEEKVLDCVSKELNTRTFDLNYDIHIHLPATRDQSVYDALFASLAKHLSSI